MSIGYHIHKNGRSFIVAIGEELERATDHGIEMKTFQIFAMGPRNANINVTAKDTEFFRTMSDEGYRIIVHGSYLDAPWGKKSAAAIGLIKKEFKVCEVLGAYGMIIHLPQLSPTNILPVLNQLLAAKHPRLILYLEVGSVKATADTYETPEKIAALFAGITDRSVGFCVDTAHLWSSGVDISTRDLAEVWIRKFKTIGIQHVTIALNDQVNALGSGCDQHAALTYGTIFGKYNAETGDEHIKNSGLAAFLDWAISDDIPVILERHDDTPKFHGLPVIKNIDSDLITIHSAGYFR